MYAVAALALARALPETPSLGAVAAAARLPRAVLRYVMCM